MFDLYISETCPYCKKVMKFLDENNISYNKFDTANKDNILRLMTIGGKDQVPFLDDKKNNIKMYESQDIIDYIKGTING